MEDRRTLMAILASALILITWQTIFPYKKSAQHSKIETKNQKTLEDDSQQPTSINVEENNAPRIAIRNQNVEGSINLKGLRIDNLYLNNYKSNIKEENSRFKLLSSATEQQYIVALGILNSAHSDLLPKSDSVWSSNGDTLSPGNDVRLHWSNNNGSTFFVDLSIDDDSIINIKHSVHNQSNNIFSASPYITIQRNFGEDKATNAGIHQGGLVMANGQVNELSFKDISKKTVRYNDDAYWAGFSDKYWLTAVIPQQKYSYNIIMSNKNDDSKPSFQSDVIASPQDAKLNTISTLFETNLFVGAKVLSTLDNYKDTLPAPLFDKALDFGRLYFITKPLFILLGKINAFCGNFGLALMLLTVIIKVALFPLAFKSFNSMRKLKDIGPEIVEIKERYKNDPAMSQKKILEKYKQKNINPVSGCLPIILQMPVFFAIYKVLSVTIEMRHAPFYLWLDDLSAPDSTTIFNLFGLIDWTPPKVLMIGVLPIMMSFSMFIQQKLTPQNNTDPNQAKVMQALPLIFLIMFSSFPSGLLLYWTWSNILSITQQILMNNVLIRCKKSKI